MHDFFKTYTSSVSSSPQLTMPTTSSAKRVQSPTVPIDPILLDEPSTGIAKCTAPQLFADGSNNSCAPHGDSHTQHCGRDEPGGALALAETGHGSHRAASSHAAAVLTQQLPLPPGLNVQGLTQSERIFAVATGVDPRSLRINQGEEFFLFMSMREMYKWRTYSMNSKRYADGVKTYNLALEPLAQRKGFLFVEKNPRALLDKLTEIEAVILKRCKTKNFTCTYLHINATP